MRQAVFYGSFNKQLVKHLLIFGRNGIRAFRNLQNVKKKLAGLVPEKRNKKKKNIQPLPEFDHQVF